MHSVRFTTDLSEIDWQALKAALTADQFDNGRTPEQYELSARNSYLNVFAFDGDEIVGNARILSDGVCNAYVVDVWTRTDHRRRGIAREVMRMLLMSVPGQHVYLATDDAQPVYAACGFRLQPDGMGRVVGKWLDPNSDPGL